MAKRTKEERKEIVKKVFKKIGIALGVVLSIVAVAVSAYTAVKFTAGPGNQLNAPGSNLNSHDIVQNSPDVNTNRGGSIGGISNGDSGKGDNYYEETTPIEGGEEQEENPYRRIDTEDDEMSL